MNPLSAQSSKFLCLAILAVVALSLPILAADERAAELGGNTILISGAVAAASVLLGAPLAFLLSRSNVVARKPASLLLLALVFTPLYLQATAWQAGFGLHGWCTSLVGGLPPLEGWRGAIAVHTLAAIPWVVAIVGLGLRLAEPELEEEALLDATPGRVFRRVTLKRSSQAIVAAFLWVAITTAGEMTVTDLFQVRTFAEQLYTEFALGDTLGAAPWNLLPSGIVAAWVIVAGLVLTSRLVPPDRHASQRESRVFRLGPWRAPASIVALSAVGLLFGVPLVNLVAKAGMVVSRHGPQLVRHWSPRQFVVVVLDSPLRFSREFGWSIAIGSLAATAAVVIGLALAWNAREGGWRAAGAWLTIALGLAVPGPLVGLGLIACFNTPEWPWLVYLYDHSIAVICIAQTLRALPLCTLVLWYALRTIPADTLHSATLEGATALTRFFRVALPERWPAVAVAWLVALAVAWGELSASILVAPPGVITLPIQIFGLIHYGVDDRVAGVSLSVLATFFLLAMVVAVLARRAPRDG